MTLATYTYCILRYVHDHAAGEALNIGVMLHCPAQRFLDVTFDFRFERLSSAFAEFDGAQYRTTLRRFELALERFKNVLTERQDSLFQQDHDLHSIVAALWPDPDLSFQSGPIMAGLTEDAHVELKALLDKFVLDQYERKERPRRTSDDVWETFKEPLRERHLLAKVEARSFGSPDFEYVFERAIKNGRWHVLESVSFDYARSETLQERAIDYLGIGTALQQNQELGTLFLLVGRPTSQSHQRAYERAKHLLERIPVRHEIVEETEANTFADRLADLTAQEE
jgi:hypothetical protein